MDLRPTLLRITALFVLLSHSMYPDRVQFGFAKRLLADDQIDGSTLIGANLFDTNQSGERLLVGNTHLGKSARFVVFDVSAGKDVTTYSLDRVLIIPEGHGSISPSGKSVAAVLITEEYEFKVLWWRIHKSREQVNEVTFKYPIQSTPYVKWKSENELYVGTDILEVLKIHEERVEGRRRLLPKYNEFRKIAFAPNNKTFAVVVDHYPGEENKKAEKPRYSVLLCNSDKERENVKTIYETDTKIRHLEFSVDGKVLLVGANSDESVGVKPVGDGKIVVCQISDLGEVVKNTFSSPQFWSVALHPGNELLAIGRIDGSVSVQNVNTRKIMITFNANKGPVMHLRFLQQGKSLMSGSIEGEVRLWDPKTGKMQRDFNVMEDLSK